MKDVARLFDVEIILNAPPRYNIAPTQQVFVVRRATDAPARELVPMHWGFVPFWADDPSIGNRMINARGETVAEKPAFRRSFRSRRCLIPADGFYEWQRQASGRQPYYITIAEGGPFALAGLWDRWNAQGQPLDSCTIITTEANDLLRPIHDRMPVILSRDDFEQWLDPTVQEPAELKSLLRPLPADALRISAVRPVVNNPRNDTQDCIAPLAK